MGINGILPYLTVTRKESIGNITFYRAFYNNDVMNVNPLILVDLSHQTVTRSNYISSLTTMADRWGCRNIVFYLNADSPSLHPNLVPYNYFMVSAAMTPFVQSGYMCFPLLWQDEYRHEGLFIWVPELQGCMSQYELDNHISDSENYNY